jgi:hypothetical protein
MSPVNIFYSITKVNQFCSICQIKMKVYKNNMEKDLFKFYLLQKTPLYEDLCGLIIEYIYGEPETVNEIKSKIGQKGYEINNLYEKLRKICKHKDVDIMFYGTITIKECNDCHDRWDEIYGSYPS